MVMKQEAIITTLSITRIGESQFFQITLPADTIRIIGVEYDVTAKQGEIIAPPDPADNSFDMKASKPIGRLTLRNTGCQSVFLKYDLAEDRNIHLGELFVIGLPEPQLWSHGRKKFEMELSVARNSIVQGFYQDSWGRDEYQALRYELNLYLWIEKCIAI